MYIRGARSLSFEYTSAPSVYLIPQSRATRNVLTLLSIPLMAICITFQSTAWMVPRPFISAASEAGTNRAAAAATTAVRTTWTTDMGNSFPRRRVACSSVAALGGPLLRPPVPEPAEGAGAKQEREAEDREHAQEEHGGRVPLALAPARDHGVAVEDHEVQTPVAPPAPHGPGEPDLLGGVDLLGEAPHGLEGLAEDEHERTGREAQAPREAIPACDHPLLEGRVRVVHHDRRAAAADRPRPQALQGLVQELGGDVGVGVHEDQETPLGLPGPRVARPRDLVPRLGDDPRPGRPGDLGRAVRGVVVAHHELAAGGYGTHGRAQAVEGEGEQRLLVVGGHDDGVVWPRHLPSIREKPAGGRGGSRWRLRSGRRRGPLWTR